MAPRRLLAVFPHPDDESYGCAGVLAREGRRDDTATALLCLTRGEASSIGRAGGRSPDEVGSLRETRLERVSEILRLDALLVPGLPDGRLSRCRLDDVAAAIGEVLDALEPQVVVTHCARGVNGHADHVATHWAVRHALLTRPGIRLALVAYPPEDCEAARPRLLFATPVTEIDVVVDLTEDEVDAKEACLRVHEAIATLRDDGDPDLFRRPHTERFDLLGEEHDPVLSCLFESV